MKACPVSLIENLADGKTITVVIPLRVSTARPDAIKRLHYIQLDPQRPEAVEILIVDDGSDYESAEKVRNHCRDHGYAYLHVESDLVPIANGRSRNLAAMHARSPFLFMQDLDLMPYPGFYSDLLQEIEVQKLPQKNDSFIMCPVVYLTEQATEEFRKTKENLRKSIFIQYLLENDKSRIEKVSSGTSACVYSRSYYLARGGMHSGFANWGYEDLEFNIRLIRHVNKFSLPRDWELDYRNFSSIVEYRGWKASYRLMGDISFLKGIVLFHGWHKVNKAHSYMQNVEENRKFFTQCLKEYAEEKSEPTPLPDLNAGRSLILRKNAFTWQRDVAPLLGQPLFKEADSFASAEEFCDFLKKEEISRVIFQNPYRDENTIMLYRTCRENNIPYVVCERGALRESVFFDPNGFNADSSSYHPDKWNHPIDDNQRACVMDYIAQERSVDYSLEAQSNRLGDTQLLQKLGIPSNKKILFVPYQRPGDTVITHLCGPIGTFENFLKLVRDTAAKLSGDWVMVTKRHPLEDVLPDMPGVIQADDANIKDLLDVADALLLINSGVGVLGMIWEKPVLYAGQAFYAHPEINVQVSTPEQVMQVLNSGFKPNREKIFRFLSYLLHDFYSFGEFITRPARMPDGSRITATTDIRFRTIRFPGHPEINLYTDTEPQIGFDSVLFDRYRHAEDTINGIKPPLPNTTPPSLKRVFKDFAVGIIRYPWGIRRRIRGVLRFVK